MTVCNMTIEAGGRAGMIAPDETTFAWLARARRRRSSLPGASCASDDGAAFDTRDRRRRGGVKPDGDVGDEPRDGRRRRANAVPEPAGRGDERALAYMGLEPGTPIEEIAIDRVFIGSCTNSRIGDLRAAADVVKGRRVAAGVDAMVVPGSEQVRRRPRRRGWTRCYASRVRLARRPAARCASG